eukprot:5490605-Prymnesium_polylepis.1
MHFVGKDVEPQGLVVRADLNGRHGVVLTFDQNKGRCAVRFGNSEPAVLIKPSNLQPVTIPLEEPRSVCEGDEEQLITAVQQLKIAKPQATSKELHATLTANDWPDLSLGDVKKAASKASKRQSAHMADSRSQSQRTRKTTEERHATASHGSRAMKAGTWTQWRTLDVAAA